MSFSDFFERLQQQDENASPGLAAHWSAALGSSWPLGESVGTRGSMQAAAEGYKDVCEAAESWLQSRAVTPEDIARELGLSRNPGIDELKRIRRLYALSNHPDVATDGSREAATRRMQIANLLIDEALRRAGAAEHE